MIILLLHIEPSWSRIVSNQMLFIFTAYTFYSAHTVFSARITRTFFDRASISEISNDECWLQTAGVWACVIYELNGVCSQDYTVIKMGRNCPYVAFLKLVRLDDHLVHGQNYGELKTYEGCLLSAVV